VQAVLTTTLAIELVRTLANPVGLGLSRMFLRGWSSLLGSAVLRGSGLVRNFFSLAIRLHHLLGSNLGCADTPSLTLPILLRLLGARYELLQFSFDVADDVYNRQTGPREWDRDVGGNASASSMQQEK
jgi:hypothetical protein